MRQYLWAFLTLFMTSLSAQDAENVKVTYQRTNSTLVEIFDDLESQYGIRFSYATSSIEEKRIDAKFSKEPIESVLDFLLAEESMEYKIVSNNILIRKSESFTVDKNDEYQSTIHIKGKVVSKQNTKERLDYATISITNSSIGTYSDENGRFDIEIPEKYLNESIVIHYLGYENEIYKISELDNEYLLVPMKSGQLSFDEIMIVNKEKPLKLGNFNNAIQLNGTQINSGTSGVMGSDIGRQIQLLPGISAHDDDSAEIKIRGSNSDETLLILDGMPIYNSSHYYGIFSGINTAYIDSVNVFKNTYPLQYGGKTAGLVELFSAKEQATKTKANFQINLLTSSVDVIIPLSTNSQLSLAGRSTNKDVNNNQFNTANTAAQVDPSVEAFGQNINIKRTDPSFIFHDINAKYQYRNAKNDFFAINLYKSGDEVDNSFPFKVTDKNENELSLFSNNEQSWSNNAASLIFKKSLTSKLRWHTTAYVTKYTNNQINEFQLDKKNKQGVPPNSQIPQNVELGSEQKNEVTDISLDSHLDYKIGTQLLQFGLTTTHHDINYRFSENNKQKLIGKDSFLEFGGYFGHEILISKKLNLNSALRAIYFSNLETTTLSPRFLLNYKVTERFSLKSSFSIENQVIRQLSYEYLGEPLELWVTSGQNGIPILNSTNFMIGSTLKLGSFALDVELFQKYKKGVTEYLNPNPADPSNSAEQDRNYQLFIGDGLTRGVDFIISSGYKQYDTYLSYTLSQSEERYKEIFNYYYFPSELDRRHQLKWVNSLTMGNFTWGLNSIFASGRPYTDILNVGRNGDIRDLNPNNRLRRLRPYHRLDISGTYKFKLKRLDASLSASVFNLLNTKNVKYIQSISTEVNANQQAINTIIGNESELLNRTFNIELSIGF